MAEGSSSSRSNGERRAIELLQEAQELLESRLPKKSNQTSVTQRQSTKSRSRRYINICWFSRTPTLVRF